jgi:hypothetical protein
MYTEFDSLLIIIITHFLNTKEKQFPGNSYAKKKFIETVLPSIFFSKKFLNFVKKVFKALSVGLTFLRIKNNNFKFK